MQVPIAKFISFTSFIAVFDNNYTIHPFNDTIHMNRSLDKHPE